MTSKTAEQNKLRLVQSNDLQGNSLHGNSADLYLKRIVADICDDSKRGIHSLHSAIVNNGELKPQIADYCIQRYSAKSDVVLDPFCGRGASLLQANLLGRVAWGCDVNPLSVKITSCKLSPVGLDEIVLRLNQIDFTRPVALSGYSPHLAAFYHPDTYRELMNLKSGMRRYPDSVSRFMELLAMSRLHGHTPAYFSAYTFPQCALPAARQQLINRRRREDPEHRAVAPRIIKKAAQVLRDGLSSKFHEVATANIIRNADARNLRFVPNSSIDFVLTQPQLVNNMNSISDYWLEHWFSEINSEALLNKLTFGNTENGIGSLKDLMADSLSEMLRVLKPGRHLVLIFSGEYSEDLLFDETIVSLAESIRFQEKRFILEEILINKDNLANSAPRLSRDRKDLHIDKRTKSTNTTRLMVFRAHAPRVVKSRLSRVI